MNERTEQLIRDLAEKLGTTTEEVWVFLIKQAVIQGWSSLLITILMLAVVIWAIQILVSCIKREKNFFESEDNCMGLVIIMIASLVVSIPIYWQARTAATCFANPEYWAFSEVVRKLK